MKHYHRIVGPALCCVLLVSLSPLLGSGAAAQEPDLRVDIADGHSLRGYLVNLDDQSIELRTSKGERKQISLSEVTSIEEVIGYNDYRLRGTLIGAGVGALVLLVIFSVDDNLDQENLIDNDLDGGDLAKIGLVGAALGGVVGLGIGAAHSGERWGPFEIGSVGRSPKPVELSVQLRLAR